MDLSRRGFLGVALAAGVMGFKPGDKTQVALQLYSVRGLMKDQAGYKKTLKAVRDIGYVGVEMAGYCGFSPAELKKLLDDLGLQRAGTHTGLDTLMPNQIQKTLDFNLGYDNHFLTVPWMRPADNCKDKLGFWKKFAEDMSIAAETAKKSGCVIAYHNHQHEFRDKINGVTPFQIIFDAASPELCVQPDVGHIVSAGEDPVFWVSKYGKRVKEIHAKEVYGGNSGATGVLGQPGKAKGVDWASLYKATDAAKVQWYIVECESNPNTMEHVRDSFAFLHATGRC